MASQKIRRKVYATEGLRTGEIASDKANYTDFGETGRQTMSGSAKTWNDLWLPAMLWSSINPEQFAAPQGLTYGTGGSPGSVGYFDLYGGASGSDNNGSRINVPVLAGSTSGATDARASVTFLVPPDADTTGSVYATLYFFERAEHATAGSLAVFRTRYRYFGSKGKNNGGASGSVLYTASLLSSGSGALEIHQIATLPSFTQASPLGILELGVEASNASAAGGSVTQDIIGMRLRYRVANIGGSAYNA